ncbi:hypothetical protein MAPG_05755 [Magnaporthiopsis poae ATCC 64411]|uniref:Uncharacterized protein n=1 Tax=Magnaporthiopsis poae (strain ATCC 64411 / 73-15) TaxID=644358 RepID=A0A0C4E089_MAGP6|nr:hypothetical protein MAPG_05755 [Magnaporthiopsis poae ATCC 64411]
MHGGERKSDEKGEIGRTRARERENETKKEKEKEREGDLHPLHHSHHVQLPVPRLLLLAGDKKHLTDLRIGGSGCDFPLCPSPSPQQNLCVRRWSGMTRSNDTIR